MRHEIPTMIYDKSIPTEAIVIGGNHWDVPLRVELRAYLGFSHRLDMQLRRLVIRWGRTAAPRSRIERKEERGEGREKKGREEIER